MKRLLFLLILIPAVCFASSPIVGLLQMWNAAGTATPADVVLLPTTDSATYNAWAASSGSDKYAMVDDAVGAEDGDTTYITINTQNSSQRFTNLPALSAGTILGVSVCGHYKESGEWSGYFSIGVNGTSYHSTEEALTTSYAEHCYEWTVNPNTTTAWTETDVEGTGAAPLQNWGANSVKNGAAGEIYATAVRLKVRYN